METQTCATCSGTGIMNPGTEWVQFCPDCVTGNALALKNCGSNLDPAKYPACHYDIDTPGCNDQGLFPDGTSCDCDRVSILGFESMGLSHEITIKLMAVLTSCEEGCSDPLNTLVNRIDETRDRLGMLTQDVPGLTKLIRENPESVQQALDHNYLRRFL